MSVKLHKPKKKPPDPSSIPREADFDRIAAGEPGVDFLCTVKVNESPEGDYIRMSTAKYRHMAKLKQQQHWNQNIRKKPPGYVGIIQNMPMYSVTSTRTYVENLKYILKHSVTLSGNSSKWW